MRVSDRNRVLSLLADTDGLSNLRIKEELGLSDERYSTVRDNLLDDSLVEKYVCRGGGIRLTREGERKSPAYHGPSSDVGKESELYGHLVDFLHTQAEEDGVEVVAIPTHVLRSRGKWQNPDVTRIAIENYHHLRKMRVTVATYEVKKFPEWDVNAVYEAASHHRFAHEAWVVLEWPKKAGPFSVTSPTYKIDQVVRECQRFGIGLATLDPHYKGYRLRERLEPKPSAPDDEDVEIWLGYVFSRNESALGDYDAKVQTIQQQVRSAAAIKNKPH